MQGKIYMEALLTMLRLCLGGLVFGLFGATTVLAQASDIRNSYLQLAFTSEFDGLQVSVDRLKKRMSGRPIAVLSIPLVPAPIDETFTAIRSVVAELNDQSPELELVFVEPADYQSIMSMSAQEAHAFFDDSVTIYVGSRDEIIRNLRNIGGAALEIFENFVQKAPENRACFGLAYGHGAGTYFIGRAFVFLEYSGPDQLTTCLYEEIMQTFGIPGDLDAGSISIFNDDDVYSVPTEFDWTLWRLHQSPALRAGMTKSEVADQLNRILD